MDPVRVQHLIIVDASKQEDCLPLPPLESLGAVIDMAYAWDKVAYVARLENASEANKELAMLAVHAFSIAQHCVGHADFIMSEMRGLTKTIVTDLYVVYQMAKDLGSVVITSYIEGLFSSVGSWSTKNLGGRYIHDGEEIVFAALL